MGTIGYWKFARLLNVGCPWILLLPVHNLAYIGILGNVARHEDGLREGLDLSVWYVLLWIAVIGSCVALWKWFNYLVLTGVGMAVFLLYVVGMELHYCLFKLYSKHPGLVSLVWWFPGVILWQALVAEKRLEESV